MTARSPPRSVPSFIDRELKPNLMAVLTHGNVKFSLLIGAITGCAAYALDERGRIDIDTAQQILLALLTIASIALGFLTTALVMTISLAKGALGFLLSESGRYKNQRSPFANLSFVIVWSALAQIFVVVCVVVNLALISVKGPLGHGIPLAVDTLFITSVATYAGLQFVATLLTMSQVSDAVDRGPSEAPPQATDRPKEPHELPEIPPNSA